MNLQSREFSSNVIEVPDRPAQPTLQQLFDDSVALAESDDYQGAKKLIEGFGDRLLEASRTEVVGSSVVEPVASIVIVSYRHEPNVEGCLNEVARQVEGQALEVVLVDTGNRELFRVAQRLLKSFVAVTPPFPPGASGGRNLGAQVAQAPYLIFIDDDGIMQPGCIQALLACIRETGATAVRGRVVPLSSPRHGMPHYDLGDARLPSLISCEGVSIWNKREFASVGGFDPLLFGHEGIELCGRLWRFHGPAAFVYEPKAVLHHDFADDASVSAVKKARYERNRRYVEHCSPTCYPIHSATQRSANNGRLLYLSTHAVRIGTPQRAQDQGVSVITTARNAAQWLAEHRRSWRSQTYDNFQLVFVDDGSGDGTAEITRNLWKGDDRLTLIERPFRGRGASLNAAMRQAKHDICLVADVDDISIPSRITRTISFFAENPGYDYVSFLAYTETDHFRVGAPHSPLIADMDVRALFGMPGSFPTYAFRKSRLPLMFDEDLRGGIDCDWLDRNRSADPSIKGRLIHFPAVYYRQHEGQITKNYNDSQKTVRKRLMYGGFARVLGELAEQDRRFIDILIDIRKANPGEKRRLAAWLANLIFRNEERNVYDPSILGLALLEAFDRVQVPPPNPAASSANEAKVQALREQAEVHISNRQFKDARRALRKALKLRPDPAVRSRLLAANKYAIVRALSWSKPYRAEP